MFFSYRRIPRPELANRLQTQGPGTWIRARIRTPALRLTLQQNAGGGGSRAPYCAPSLKTSSA